MKKYPVDSIQYKVVALYFSNGVSGLHDTKFDPALVDQYYDEEAIQLFKDTGFLTVSNNGKPSWNIEYEIDCTVCADGQPYQEQHKFFIDEQPVYVELSGYYGSWVSE
jgi:hypothetical protein